MIALQLFASEPSTSMRSTESVLQRQAFSGSLLPGAGVTARQREQSFFPFSLLFLSLFCF